MEHLAGDSDGGALWLAFDRRPWPEFFGTRSASDAGLLAYRELDEALGPTDLGDLFWQIVNTIAALRALGPARR